MNDFESTLVAALQDEADRRTQDVDTVLAAQLLQARMARVGRDRQRRRRVTFLAAAAVLAVAALIATNPAQPWVTQTPSPGASSSPTPSGPEALAPDPFLPVYFPYGWPLIGAGTSAPPRLTGCMDEPGRWGARTTEGRTYSARHGSGRANEYLLQYPDGSAARAALFTAADQFQHCSASGVEPAVVDSGQGIGAAYDDAYANQVLVSAPGQPEVLFVLRVARAGNVLVVLEEIGSPDEVMSDRSNHILDQTIRRALLRLSDPSPAASATEKP